MNFRLQQISKVWRERLRTVITLVLALLVATSSEKILNKYTVRCNDEQVRNVFVNWTRNTLRYVIYSMQHSLENSFWSQLKFFVWKYFLFIYITVFFSVWEIMDYIDSKRIQQCWLPRLFTNLLCPRSRAPAEHEQGWQPTCNQHVHPSWVPDEQINGNLSKNLILRVRYTYR